MFSGCEDACAPDRLDLLLRLAGEEAGLDDHRLLRQVALAKDLTGGRKKGISGLGQRVDYCLELFHKVHGRHGISQKGGIFSETKREKSLPILSLVENWAMQKSNTRNMLH